MKKFKGYIFAFLLGAITFGSIGVLASQIFARDIKYNDTNVESALNDLYSKAELPALQIGELPLTYSIHYRDSYPSYKILYPSEVLDKYLDLGYTKMRINSTGTSTDNRALLHVYFTYNGTTYWYSEWNGSWDKTETVDIVRGQSLEWVYTNYGPATNTITFLP